MGSLLPLRSKALLIGLLVAIALSGAVIAFSGGITPQSYKNALIVAALVLVPLEALRQSGVLEHLVDMLRERRAQRSRSLPSDATGATDASDHEEDLRVMRANPLEEAARHLAEVLAAESSYSKGAHVRHLAQSVIFSWVPATDVIQSDDNLVIRAELPGVKPEDVDITLQNRVLTIFGKHNADEKEERGVYHLRERPHGSFSRSITLPENPDKDDLSVRFEDGVLEVVIQGAVTEQLPIPGYDDMNVEEVSQRLHDLSEEELQLVRAYEEHHKRRETLLKLLDRQIRAT
jgi:HSP20 family protein